MCTENYSALRKEVVLGMILIWIQNMSSGHPRLAPSLCISYSTKSKPDIHGIIMNPYNTKTYLKYFCQPHILVKKSFSPHIIPKTKGLEESLSHP